MTRLRHAAEAAHLGQALLYAAITSYFAGFFVAVEYALARLAT